MVELSGIGSGLPPQEKLKEQAAYLAHMALPYLHDGMVTAREGKVTWDSDAMDLIFAGLDALAPLIDEGDFDEGEKLLLHGVFSFLIRSRQAGMLTEKKMKMIAAVLDVFIELYSDVAQIVNLEVDRSGV
jgi:hypothetical protein